MEEKHTLRFLKVFYSIWLDKLLRIRELFGFNGYLIFNKDFVNEITFWPRHRKKCDKKNACVQLGNSKQNNFLKSKGSY